MDFRIQQRISREFHEGLAIEFFLGSSFSVELGCRAGIEVWGFPFITLEDHREILPLGGGRGLPSVRHDPGAKHG